MKQNWKRFVALFMAIAMILVSGLAVTNASFRAEGEPEMSDIEAEIISEETPVEEIAPQAEEITEPEITDEMEEDIESQDEEDEEDLDALDEEDEEEEEKEVEVVVTLSGITGTLSDTDWTLSGDGYTMTVAFDSEEESSVINLPTTEAITFNDGKKHNVTWQSTDVVIDGYSATIPGNIQAATIYAVDEASDLTVALSSGYAPAEYLTIDSIEGKDIGEGNILVDNLPQISGYTDEYGREVTFRGWAISQDTVFEEARTDRLVVSSGATIYAIWSVPVIVSVEYQNEFGDDGRAPVIENTYDVTLGGTKTVIMPAAPTMDYTTAYGMAWGLFACDLNAVPLGSWELGNWRYYQATCGKPFEISADVPMYAGTIQIETFTFTYNENANGDEVEGTPEDMYFEATEEGEDSTDGTQIYNLFGFTFSDATPTRNHYSFYEWNNKANDSGRTFTPGEKLVFSLNNEKIDEGWFALTERDYVVYAQWIPHAFIEFLPNGDGVINMPENIDDPGNFDNTTKMATYSPVEINGLPQRPGYIFTGWTSDEEGTKPVSGTIVPDSRMLNGEVSHYQFYAQWTKVADIQIVAGSGSNVYDGKNHAGDSVDYSVIIGGFPVAVTSHTGNTITLSNGLTLVGDISAAVSGSEVKNVGDNYITTANVGTLQVFEGDKEVTEFYNVLPPQNGKYTITPKAVTIKSASANRVYNGKLLEKHELEIVPDFIEGDTYTVEYTGKQLLVGDSKNTYNLVLGNEAMNSNYTITPLEGDLVVTANTEPLYTITIEGVKETYTYDKTEHIVKDYTINGQETNKNFLGTIVGFFTGNEYPKFTITTDEGTKEYTITVEVEQAKGTDVGPYAEKITGYKIREGAKDVTDQFKVIPKDGELIINPASVTLRAPSAEKEYDGQPLENKDYKQIEIENSTIFTAEDLENYNFTIEGSQTEIGTGKNTITNIELKEGVKENYVITPEQGNLVVTGDAKYDVVLNANSNSKTYDGQPMTVSGFYYTVGDEKVQAVKQGYDDENAEGDNNGSYVLTYTSGNLTFTITGLTAQLTQTDAGDYTVNITGQENLEVRNQSGQVVTDQFGFSYNPGTLKINPVDITIKSAILDKDWDGSALTNGNKPLEIISGAFIGTDNVDVTFNASITDVGTIPNTYTDIRPAANTSTNLNNYNITPQYGTLTIKNRDAQYVVTLIPNSKSVDYNGKLQTESGFDQNHTLSGYGWEVTAENGQKYYVSGVDAYAEGTNVKDSKNLAVSGIPVVKDATGKVVTEQFDVQYGTGRLEIKALDASVTSQSASKVFDGTPLTNDNADEGKPLKLIQEGFLEGQGVTTTFTESVLYAGESVPNKYLGYDDNGASITPLAGTDLSNYNITYGVGQLTIEDVTEKIPLPIKANSGSKTYDGMELVVRGFEGQSEEELNGPIKVIYNGEEYTITGVTSEKTGTDAEELTNVPYTMVDVKVVDSKGKDVTNQFTPQVEQGTFEILKRPVVIKSADAEKVYDGKPIKKTDEFYQEPFNAATNSGFVGTDGVVTDENSFTSFTRPAMDINNEYLYAAKEGTDLSNYIVDPQYGKLSILNPDAKYDIVLKTNSETYDYDGTVKEAKGFNGTYSDGNKYEVEINGVKYTVENVTAFASGKNVSDSKEVNVNISGAIVRDEDGEDVTNLFNVSATKGFLTINPIPVTLESLGDEKEFDGDPLTRNDPDKDFKQSGFIGDEGVIPNITGTITYKGEVYNEYTYTAKDGTDLKNYTITEIKGILKIRDRDAQYEITLIGNSETYDYDGTIHVVKGFNGIDTDDKTYEYEVSVDNKTYYVSNVTSYGEAKNVKDSLDKEGNKVPYKTAGYIVKDAKGEDVTNQFNLTVEPGTLTIRPLDAYLESAGDWKYYDGYALEKNDPEKDFTQSGFITGEGVNPTITGTITLKGETENIYTYVAKPGTDLDNYIIHPSYGILEIKDREAKYEITLHAESYDGVYDGKEHEADGFKEEYSRKLIFFGNTGYEVEVEGNMYYVTGVSSYAKGTDVTDSVPEIVPVTEGYKVSDKDNNDVTKQFNLNIVRGHLNITKRNVVLTSEGKTFPFDPENHVEYKNEKVNVSGDGFAKDEGADYYNFAGITYPGEIDNTFSYTLNDKTNEDNYNITPVYEKLKVTSTDAIPVSVKANSYSEAYDGKEHPTEGFENETSKGIAIEVGGKTYYVTGLTSSTSLPKADGSAIDVKNVTGKQNIPYQGTAKVVDQKDKDVTSLFAVNVIGGTFEITQKDLILTSKSLSKRYDELNGQALVNGSEPLEVEEGFVENEGATYNFTGSRKAPGKTEKGNIFDIATLYPGTSIDNYNVIKTFGDLEVTKDGVKFEVTINANGYEDVYDGKEHEVKGFEGQDEDNLNGPIKVTVNGVEYTIIGISNEKSGKDVENSTTNVTGTYIVEDSDGNDLTDLFDVNIIPGKFIITKADLHIKSASAEMMYTGNPLTAESNEIETGWKGTDGASYSYSGSQTLVGTSYNGYDIIPNDGTKMSNYKLIKEFGILKVNDGDTTPNDPSNPGDPTPNKPSGIVDKSHKLAENGREIIFKEGDKVPFQVKIKNIYDQTMDAELIEQKGVTFVNGKTTIVEENMAPGEERTVEATYTIQAEDADENNAGAGHYYNFVTARFTVTPGTGQTPVNPDPTDPNGDDPDKQPPAGIPETPDDGGTYEDDDDVPVFIERPAISVRKEANVGQAKVGDTIDYTIYVVNQGNVDLTGVKVTDDLYNDGILDHNESYDIPAGDTLKITLSHKVNAEDARRGTVYNVAVATADDPRDPANVPDSEKDSEGNPNPITSSDDESVVIDNEFKLTIHYVDTTGRPVAADYSGVYKVDDIYKVTSPEIEGYVLQDESRAVMAGAMPAQDLELTVVYINAPEEEEPEVPETPEDPEDPETPENPDDPGTPDAPAPGPNTPAGPTPGTVVTVTDDGTITLRSVDDVDTALANMNLGHIDNILYFVILLATTIAFYLYCRSSRKHQERIFELRSELGEDDPYRKENKN